MFVDIGRERWDSFARSNEAYVQCFAKYLPLLSSQCRMVVFVDSRVYDEITRLTCDNEHIVVVALDASNLEAEFPLWAEIERVRRILASDKLKRAVGERVKFPECSVAEYVMVNNCKVNAVRRAMDLVVADLYGWTDFGLFSDYEPPAVLCPEKVYYPSKISLCVRRLPLPEDASIEKTLRNAPEVVIGGFFLGDRRAILSFEKLFEETLRSFHDQGYTDDDQGVVLHALFKNPSLFCLVEIPSWKVHNHICNANRETPRVMAFIMAKDEVGVIERSVYSLKGAADGLILFDTGSADETVEVCRRICAEIGISFWSKSGAFVDFSTSRNEGLDFCDAVCGEQAYDFLLLMDAGDELVGGHVMREALLNIEFDALYMEVELLNVRHMTLDSVRLIRPLRGLRYKGRVHETIQMGDKSVVKMSLPFKLFQDRQACALSTQARLPRDIELLTLDVAEARTDEEKYRAVFYLANTYSDLGDVKARDLYLQRLEYPRWSKERFWAQFQVARIDARAGEHKDAMRGFFRCLAIEWRAEALLEIAKMYAQIGNFDFAFFFAQEAAKVEVPDIGVFVEHFCYDYDRFHYLSVYAYEVGEYEQALGACLRAIEGGREKQYDVSADESNIERIRARLKETC